MNLTERAEIRRETFYKLTNSRDVPEVPANAHRNLAQTTSSSWSKPYTSFNGGINRCADLGKVLTDGMRSGDTVKTRIVLKYDNIVPAEGKTVKCWWQGSGNVTDWNRGGFPNTGGQKVLNGSGEIVFEGTDTINSDHLKNAYWSCNIRFDYVASGSIQWKEEKVEIGKNFTPYTPAPEQLGWSTDTLVPTKTQRYLWKFEYIYYSDGSVEIAGPVNLSIAGQDADATEAINKTKQELLEKLETVRDDSLEAVDEAKQQLVTVRNESLAAAEEAKQGLINVTSELNTAKQNLANSVAAVNTKVDNAKADFQNAVSAVDTKATNLKNDLTQAKQDLNSQAQQLQAQASAQSELSNRVSSVEKTANGTKTTVSELSKTVAQNGKDITSVTARTKVVEDDLAGTKTTLSQVQTTANTTSQKTATLETGLNGLNARFDNLKIGSTNLLLYSSDPWQAPSGYYQSNGAARTEELLNGSVVYKTRSIWSRLAMNWGKHLIDRKDVKVGDEFTYSVYVRTDQESPIKARLFFRYSGQSGTEDMTGEKTITQEWQRFTKKFTVTQKMVSDSSKLSWVGFEQTSNSEDGKFVYYACNKLERGNIATDYSPNEADLEQKVAEYKQNADQNYASLQTTVQNLDGTVQYNKTTAEQTAQGFKTRIESLETYKNGESERANAYFQSAKTETAKQLTAERTAIANNYVAKSTYTSDVTGIRNDLSATTTTANTIKTNLANYQASNDRAVANLQSNLQTANGNISSLKTKVEAVPGQITSAVSAVEGKIPTSAGGRNLALGTSADWDNGWTNFNGQNNQARSIYRIYNRGLKNGDKVNLRLVLKYSDIVATDGQTAKISLQCSGNVTVWGAGGLNGQSVYLSPDDNEVVLSRTTTITDDHLRNDYWNWGLRVDYVASGRIQWKEAKAEAGDLPTPWSPAPEDTAEQISNLSSQIKQTADGITLLATKTELNTAKNELQSGINTANNKANSAQSTANNAQNTANNATNKANSNAQTISTHTTQISALNTGLQAKVSQTDFNTLSGRVTSAENNITAKANELSSKITSVESKIPTSVGGTNLLLYSADPWQAPQTGYYQFFGTAKTSETYNGAVVYKTSGAWSRLGINLGKHLVERRLLKVGDVLTYSVLAKTDQKTPIQSRLFVRYDNQSGTENINGKNETINLTNEWKKISVTFTVTEKMLSEEHRVNYLGWEQTTNSESGKFVYYTCNKIERGNIATDYNPAPEDTATQISSLTSQIQQTKDGITLLATKTELNTAKNELQSGITTATSKADNAQSTANNNAQTISTHTTQISALNTGLSAKVSQTEFNTLSGRVTSAENNITAKANELSSKITTVEGKIPTEIGAVNLFKGSRDFSSSNWINNHNGAYAEDYQGVKIVKTQAMWNGRSQYFEVKAGEEYVFSAYVRSSAKTDGVNFYLPHDSKQPKAEGVVSFGSDNGKVNVNIGLTDKYKRIAVKIKITKDGWMAPRIERYNSDNYLFFGGYKLERGNVATGWTPAPEDTQSDIAKLSSEVKQTADGMTLLATKTELNSAKSDLQSGISTATNKANAAQSTADSAVTKANAAQSTANSNAQTISTHTTQISALNTGLSAKVSQTDFNTLSGRVTTAENNITAKANELSSKITSVEGKIPTSIGGANYLTNISSNWQNKYVVISGAATGSFNQQSSTTRISPKKFIAVGAGKQYTVSLKELTNVDYYFKVTMSTVDSYGVANSMLNKDEWIYSDRYTFTAPEGCKYVMISVGCDSGVTPDDLNTKFNIKLERGNIATDYSPAPEDTIEEISSLSSEFKQTTDSIKASVSSLDKSTVKSSSLTINSDGIVMKAGKSTTDVANAIGSYFAVNQNAINLFSDKINVKGSMIVDGAITGDKIKASSVDVSKIVGLDANFIKSKIEYAMIDWLKGKTITAYNGNMTIDLQNGRISFKDGSNAVYRQTSDGIHTGFLHFEAGIQGGVYAAFGTTSTRQGINSKSSEFAGIRCYRVSANGDSHDAKIDKIEVIGDTVQFGHTYHPNGTIGGGFIMQTAAYYDDPPYSLNRMVSSIESLWRILYVHGKNVGYNLSHPNFINALKDEYNAWHDMHNR